jgi:hypothetical protein
VTVPSRTRALPQIAAALVACALAASIAGACGGDDAVRAPTPDGGGEDSAVVVQGCPKPPTPTPPNGSECLLPEGTTCDFGLCATRLAQCLRGVWVFSSNPKPRPLCPAIAPNIGTDCPDCWVADVSCIYGSCSPPDASDNTTFASCPDASWVVEFRACGDAGPDVQGDGGPDAD